MMDDICIMCAGTGELGSGPDSPVAFERCDSCGGRGVGRVRWPSYRRCDVDAAVDLAVEEMEKRLHSRGV